MHITIATPMYGGMCAGAFAKSLIGSIGALSKAGLQVSFVDIYNESLITRARNTLTQIFLQSKSDYLLFIDADQTFNGQDIIRMINADKDIIAAPVPMKGINWDGVRQAAIDGKKDLSDFSGIFNVNFLPGFAEKNGKILLAEPVEVLYAGSGMMLIKRAVFEKLAEKVSEYTYDGSAMPQYDIMPRVTKIKNFWETAVVDGRLLSEDYNFCSMWREDGGQIYVDLLAKVIHIGTYSFSGSIFDKEAVQSGQTPVEEV